VAGAGAGADLSGERKSCGLREAHSRDAEESWLRVHLDDRNEKLPAKIRDAQLQKIPYMLVLGPKEAEAGTVSLRHRAKGDLGPRPLAELVEALQKEVSERTI